MPRIPSDAGTGSSQSPGWPFTVTTAAAAQVVRCDNTPGTFVIEAGAQRVPFDRYMCPVTTARPVRGRIAAECSQRACWVCHCVSSQVRGSSGDG